MWMNLENKSFYGPHGIIYDISVKSLDIRYIYTI